MKGYKKFRQDSEEHCKWRIAQVGRIHNALVGIYTGKTVSVELGDWGKGRTEYHVIIRDE